MAKTDAVKAAQFKVERMRADCASLFGISMSTFDGATHGLDGEYTVEEMKIIIQKWMEKEVEV